MLSSDNRPGISITINDNKVASAATVSIQPGVPLLGVYPQLALYNECRLADFNRIRYLSAVCVFPRPLTLAAAVKPLWRAGLPSPQKGRGLFDLTIFSPFPSRRERGEGEAIKAIEGPAPEIDSDFQPEPVIVDRHYLRITLVLRKAGSLLCQLIEDRPGQRFQLVHFR